MKRSLMALAIMLGCTTIVSAQTAAPAKTAVKPTAAKVTKVEKPVAATTAAPAKTATAKTKPAPVKADGTPDMRYKENKVTAKTAPGPKKADGTPDMRYKANKTTKGKS